MKMNQVRLASAAVAVAPSVVSAGVHASLVPMPQDNTIFQGAGLGRVNTVLTLGSPGAGSSVRRSTELKVAFNPCGAAST